MSAYHVLFLPLRLVSQTISFAFGEGSWSLRRYELEVIDAASLTLSARDKAILAEQLKSSLFVQRFHQDRMVGIYPQFPDRWRRMDLPDEYQLAKLQLSSPKGSTSVSVDSFKGHIRELKFGKPPQPIIGGGFEIVKSVFGGLVDHEVARSIDRSEHPSDMH